MADPFTPDEESSVSITLKAGKDYSAPWVVLKAPTVADALRLFTDAGEDLSKLLKQAAGAGVAFMNEFDAKMNPPSSGSQGKPEEAKRPSQEAGQDPFQSKAADSSDPFKATSQPEPMRACEHGKMELVEYKGKKGHVCPLPKGTQGRCSTVFV